MGYRHTDNLYKNQTVLLFRECYAMEKIHGTSAHVRWINGAVAFHSGGEKRERFVALFDEAALTAAFKALGHETVVVYGEAYGGSQQKQAWRYGDALRFVAFEVQVGGAWLSVPNAHDVATRLGIEFVHYVRCSTDLATLDAERDAPSEQARRNGVVGDKPREGVVIRPLVEMVDARGERVIAKHKRAEERETATQRAVVDPSQQAVLADAEAIAIEWVTDTRLAHVLDKLPQPHDMSATGAVVRAMVEDVAREGAGEFADTKAARQAIGKRAAALFHKQVQAVSR